ncbi:MAG: signal peptidase II [Clostridiaceae bacterium]|mgnify:FL=1|nr:signal peptidase II [Clostridiaceae bacterium]
MVTILITLDQLTKGLVERLLPGGESLLVIPDFFQIKMSLNTGAAWGFLAGTSWGIHILSLLSLLMSLLIIYWLQETTDKKARIVLSIILAGSLGNLIDRVRIGAVTDFFMFNFGSWYFPSFNVADMCITIGAGLLILFIITDKKFLNNLFRLEPEPGPVGADDDETA